MRLGRLGSAILAVALSSFRASADETVQVLHQPVGCMVAGRYPKLDACFEPDVDLVRARVFFRGLGPTWFFVDMLRHERCYTGVLPRPTGKLATIEYYVEGLDRSFGVARSETFTATVAPNAKDCAAAFLDKATVKVGTVGGVALASAGFLGAGASVATVAAVVGAGAAVAGGLASAGGGPASTTTAPTTTAAGPPAQPTPRPPTTTPGPPPTIPGTAPTTTTPSGVPSEPPHPEPSETPRPEPSETPPPSCGDTIPPQVAIVLPAANQIVTLIATVVVNANDNVGVQEVDLLVDGARVDRTSNPPYVFLWNTATVSNGRHVLTAKASDACANETRSAPVPVLVANLLHRQPGD